MNWTLIHRLTAAFVFVWSLLLYLFTVAPTTTFWDVGEFIAIANGLQVSHPPGAPFFMLLGRLFSMFVPTPYVAYAVNLVSVLASAFTVLLTHLIIVRLVREWKGHPAAWGRVDHVAALAGGVIGALTFGATDSFWFNAVEAEVYALSMFFTAIVVWLIMKWSEQVRAEEAALRAAGAHAFGLYADRYLVLIAYIFGLAIGVHLLNVLTIFFVALIVFFVKFDREAWAPGKRWTGIVVTGLVSSAAFLVIYPGIIQGLPTLVGAIGAPALLALALLALVVFALNYTQKRHMPVANLVALSVTVILIGYSTYGVIFIRSAADPPIDENDPETAEAIISYLKREQYGETPVLKGPNYNPATRQVDFDREELFPRRYSPDPRHMQEYARYDSDLEFFWKYQVGHMYVRYFLWNFVGRASDEQDARWYTGFSAREAEQYLVQSPSERMARNAYYGLPLLLGLIGMGFHFSRDWRRALSVFVLFLITGLGIIIYLNQTPFQPRERDYSYVASFFAFSLWIGLGATGLIELVTDALRRRREGTTVGEADPGPSWHTGLALALGGVIFLAVPLLVTVENYDDHDRSGNYVAPEYAYNMLMSLEPNAILFTNGDNDTFPLWYLQEVEGVRRDVRVANLSLMNTSWYIRQLKNQASRTSDPVPMSLTDAEIDRINIMPWQPRPISLPVNLDEFRQNTEVDLPQEAGDSLGIQSPMDWQLEGRPYSRDLNVLYVADQVALSILAENARQGWKRPVYFAITTSRDGQLDLQPYFQLEGMAYRVLPVRHDDPNGRIVPSIMLDRLSRFRFTNLDDPDVYFDENIRTMTDNYRNIYAQTAQALAEQNQPDRAVALLDSLRARVPFETIPGDLYSLWYMARIYETAGRRDQAIELLGRAEPIVLNMLQHAGSSQQVDYAAGFVRELQVAYLRAQAFDEASRFSSRIAEALGDSSYEMTPEELRRQFGQMPPAAGPG